MKRIFASVTEDTFRACRDKGVEEGLNLGQVLAKLVDLYVADEISLEET